MTTASNGAVFMVADPAARAAERYILSSVRHLNLELDEEAAPYIKKLAAIIREECPTDELLTAINRAVRRLVKSEGGMEGEVNDALCDALRFLRAALASAATPAATEKRDG